MKITHEIIDALSVNRLVKAALHDMVDEVEFYRGQDESTNDRFLEHLENFRQSLRALEEAVAEVLDEFIGVGREDSEEYDVEEL
jgi:hypothetical protein